MMELSFEYWYLLPVSILIATIAMSSGIGGAVFFSPLFMLGLKLDPKIAIGTALITELFGFTSGLIVYYKAKLIDFQLVKSILIFSVPAAIIGTKYGSLFEPIILKTIFSVGLLFIGYQLFISWQAEERVKHELDIKQEFEQEYESELIDKNGNVYHYTVCNRGMGRVFSIVGGVFMGMISVGLAELQEYLLVARCKVPTAVSVATSVFVVVITVFVASIGHIYEFAKEGSDVLNQVLNVTIFTVPGVIIGGYVGPKIQKSISEDLMKASISILFMVVGFFMLYTLI